MKVLIILFLYFILLNCGKSIDADSTISSGKVQSTSEPAETILLEHFLDSTQIGVAGKFQIQLRKLLNNDSTFVEVILNERANNKSWTLKQKLVFQKDGITNCNSKVEDYNDDGLGDFTFQSNVAARGANVVRKLLIFDKDSQTLKLIKNSENYPNLQYNENLHCIDSWMVYGGTSTVFLNIENDSLVEFAGVSLFNDEREIYTIDETGKRKAISSEIIKNLDIYTRFKNYNPLVVNPIEK
ncbi:MAG: hypothetical protein IR153_03830 [Flavobacterium sp.]|nr:hypothetical protein [Flavobacterium sp.]